MIKYRLFNLHLITAIIAVLITVSLSGQISNEVEKSSNTIFVIPDIVRDHLESVQNKRRPISSIIPLIESLSKQDPQLAEYAVENVFNHQTKTKLNKEWAQLLYYKTWLQIERYSEDENLEILLANVKECEEYFDQTNEHSWLVKSWSLIAIIFYHISYNNDDLFYKEATLYNNKAQHLATRFPELVENAYSILGEIYRIKGNICLKRKDCPIDSTLIAYNTGLEYLVVANDKSGQADLLLNKAIAFANLEDTDLTVSSNNSPFTYYQEAIDIYQKANDINDEAKARLEFATFLANQYSSSKDPNWYHQSNNQLQRILASSSTKKCEAYFQLAMNTQTFLSFSNSLSSQQELALLDSITHFYHQTLQSARKENNLKFFHEIFNRLARSCPYFPKANCTSLLLVADTITTHFLQKNKIINQQITNRNEIFRKMMETQKRKNLILWFIFIALLLIAVFLLLLQRQKIRNLNSKMAIKLEALRAQMNPHFISNTINAIESLVNQGRNKEASEYLIDFSRLCRLILDHSKNPNISLQEEIDTLRYFLSLEKLRLTEDMDYSISIDNELLPKEITIPSMILQPFVENAIWHGIKNKAEPKQGELKIELNKKSEHLIECIIEDNGVGRQKARELQKESVMNRKSWGTTITKQRIESLIHHKNASLQIIDLYDNANHPRGTRVIILLPTILQKLN